MDRPPGPSRETLAKLHADMPGMIDGLENQRALKGKKSAKLALPAKLCQACGRGFGHSLIAKELPDLATCDKCQAMLDQGYTAFVADNRVCFAKSKSLQDMWGTIQQVSSVTMDKLSESYNIQQREGNGSDGKHGGSEAEAEQEADEDKGNEKPE